MANFLISLFNTITKKSPNGDSYRTTQTPDKYVNDIAALNATNQSNINTANANRQSQYAKVDALGQTTIPGK